jgi:hypothetical protein
MVMVRVRFMVRARVMVRVKGQWLMVNAMIQ